MQIDPSIFKGYDIRAIIPDELDEEGMYQIGLAIAHRFKPETITVGHDMRNTSKTFSSQLTKAFIQSGINVIDVGLIATDMSYFASTILDTDLVCMITASHNPAQYNGIKMTKRGAIAISGETGIYDIRDLATQQPLQPLEAEKEGKIEKKDILEQWIDHSISFINPKKLRPFKILVDAGNGMAGHFIPALTKKLPLDITPMYFELDGSFPNHPAYPLLEEAISELKNRVKEEDFDLGISYDGDGDRMFLIDNQGEFVDGAITTALVAEYLLDKKPGSKIIYNAVCGKFVPEIITKHGGKAIRWKVGHSFLKEKMREEDALFAGEHSGHYFYRENAYADSGIITMLIALQVLSKNNTSVATQLAKYRKYPSSGEINFRIKDKQKMMKDIEEKFKSEAESTDWLDGVSVWFKDWWFNLRPSNTQPLLRLNLEINDPQNLSLNDKINAIVKFIEDKGGRRVEE